MNSFGDLGETNKIDHGTLQRIFTRFREKPEKRETASRFQVFPGRVIADRLSNFSGETVGDTRKKPIDFLVDLGETNKIGRLLDQKLDKYVKNVAIESDADLLSAQSREQETQS